MLEQNPITHNFKVFIELVCINEPYAIIMCTYDYLCTFSDTLLLSTRGALVDEISTYGFTSNEKKRDYIVKFLC